MIVIFLTLQINLYFTQTFPHISLSLQKVKSSGQNIIMIILGSKLHLLIDVCIALGLCVCQQDGAVSWRLDQVVDPGISLSVNLQDGVSLSGGMTCVKPLFSKTLMNILHLNLQFII